MNFITRNLKQIAIYWGAPVPDAFGGFTFADPVEIQCRWEDTAELFTTQAGDQVVSRAEVYTSIDLVENGYLFLGTLKEFDNGNPGSPIQLQRAYKIKRFDKLPSIRANLFERKAYL